MGKPHFSEAFRKAAVGKFLTRGDKTVVALANELGVSSFTLYGWVKSMSQAVSKQNNSRSMMSADRFDVLVSYLGLPDGKRGEFLRSRGFTSDQLSAWKTEIKSNLGSKAKDASASRAEVSAANHRVRELEKEIRRKDKALAETAALLVLSKKLEALWGTSRSEEV